MTETLVFMMGEFKAEFPVDRQYARNHMWASAQSDTKWRFGFTAYAVRLLQDVYFLEWQQDAPFSLAQGQEIGTIESKKAESSLYAPLTGQLVEFNEQLLRDPSTINVDKYAKGWLFDLEAADASPLMTAAEYVEHLVEVWEKTQRTIKGQMNE
ncbi:MAG: glycine cleavage system protein H [Pirellulaceae bacterium]